MRHKLKVSLGLLALAGGLFFGVKASASSLPIYDVSEWQGYMSATQAKRLKTEVGGLIIRVGYGSSYKDKYADHNIAMATKYKIPYAIYQFNQYLNASDAKAEAKTAYARAPHALFYVNDAEQYTTTSGSFASATKAWGAQMQKMTKKPVYLYTYRPFYNSYIRTKANYDGFWLAAYTSVRPTPYDYQLWQYTDRHYSSALGKSLDASKQVSGNWFKGATVSKSAYPYGGYKTGDKVRVHAGAKFYDTTGTIDSSLVGKDLTIKQTKTIKAGKSNQAVLLYNGSTVIGWFKAEDVVSYFNWSPAWIYAKRSLVAHKEASQVGTKAGVVKTYKAKSKLHVKALKGSRFQLTNGAWVSASKAYVNNLYYTNATTHVKRVKSVGGTYTYSDLAFKHRKTGFSHGTQFDVASVVPYGQVYRLKLANGRYISANKLINSFVK